MRRSTDINLIRCCGPVTILFLSGFLFLYPNTAETAQNPENGDTLNYTQVLFQWNAEHNAESYRLQIAREDGVEPFNSTIHDLNIETNAVVISDSLEWGGEYVWRYWRLNADGNGEDTSSVNSFSIMEFPDSLDTFESVISKPEEYSSGLTIFAMGDGNAFAFDLNGNPVALLKGYNDFEILPNGNFLTTDLYGGSYMEVVEYDLSGDDVVRTGRANFHHEIDKKSNGNYLSLCHYLKPVLDPFGGDTTRYWRGDLIIEIDIEGDTVWSWNTFDHLSTDDIDMRMWNNELNKAIFDWTHANTVHMMPDGEALYISLRHLSRIVMIAYPEGDIIWQMGKEFDSGDVDFGYDLNFSYQHDPELQPNGNFLIYDNHNLGPEDSSRALEVAIDLNDNSAESVWECWTDTLSKAGGDADRLPNGNTLLANSQVKYLVEYNADCEEVWRFTNTSEDPSGWIYRADRIPDLYPLLYTIKGPDEGHRVPAGESYFHFRINNIGWMTQTFRYEISDNQGWFAARGSVEIEGNSSQILMATGFAAEFIERDSLRIHVYPKSNPSKSEIWLTVLHSDPELSAKHITVRPIENTLVYCHPNPFNSYITFKLNLIQSSMVRLDIYDLNGRHIHSPVNKTLASGVHNTVWAGNDMRDIPVSSGSYIYTLFIDNHSQFGKIHLLR